MTSWIKGLGIFAAGATAGALGGYWAGTARPTPSSAIASAPDRPVRVLQDSTALESLPPPRPDDPFAGKPRTGQARTASDPTTHLESPQALTAEDQAWEEFAKIETLPPAEQLDAFKNLVAQITPENVETYHKAWMRGIAQKANFVWDSLYNRHLGKIHGAKVVGTRDGYNSKDMGGASSYVREQFIGWIETDPAAAEAWLDRLEHPEFKAVMEEIWNEAADRAEARNGHSSPGH